MTSEELVHDFEVCCLREGFDLVHVIQRHYEMSGLWGRTPVGKAHEARAHELERNAQQAVAQLRAAASR